jgi:ELWxxDGT repeat protein
MYQTIHEGANGLYFITLDDSIHGVELWVSDGTEAGTHIVADINPNGDSISIYTASPAYINGTLYFPANDGNHGIEVWALDIGPKAIDVDPQDTAEQIILSNNGQLKITVPPTALPTNSYKIVYDTNVGLPQLFTSQFAGVAFSLNLLDVDWTEIKNPTFDPPLIVEIQYDPEQLPDNSNETEIFALFFNEATGNWEQLTILERNPEQNKLTVEVPHFTDFALGTPNKIFLPITVRE